MTDGTNSATGADTTNRPGRPSKAELDARAAALAEREETIALREREAEIKLAEANAGLRELDLERVERSIPQPAVAARSGSFRSTDARTETVTDPLRQRRYRHSEIPNEFHIPDEQIPDGTSYQWNNFTVFGQGNPSQDSYMAMQGWRPVPASRHPHLMPEGATGPVIVKGQILVERPMELTREALQEDYERAVGEVKAKEAQLYGERPDTPAGRSLGISKVVEKGAPVKPNYQYDTGGPVIE